MSRKPEGIQAGRDRPTSSIVMAMPDRIVKGALRDAAPLRCSRSVFACPLKILAQF